MNILPPPAPQQKPLSRLRAASMTGDPPVTQPSTSRGAL